MADADAIMSDREVTVAEQQAELGDKYEMNERVMNERINAGNAGIVSDSNLQRLVEPQDPRDKFDYFADELKKEGEEQEVGVVRRGLCEIKTEVDEWDEFMLAICHRPEDRRPVDMTYTVSCVECERVVLHSDNKRDADRFVDQHNVDHAVDDLS